jgi:hypothetical protein
LNGYKLYLIRLVRGRGGKEEVTKKMIKIILLIFISLTFSLSACDGLSIKPHKTSVTYSVSDTEKDNGKDSVKESFTIKQDFVWEE